MTDHSLLESVRREARGVAPAEERAQRIADLTRLGKDDQALFEASPLVQLLASDDPSQHPSRAAGALWAIRWKVGKLLGWDGPDAGLGSRVPTLRDRLPEDLRDAPSGPDRPALPFTSLYLIDDGWAAEIANRTMH